MPRAPDIPEALRGKVFRGSTVIRRGLLTPDQLRSSAWRRIRRDVYADAGLPVDHGLAVAACALSMPKRALVAGRSAAWLYGVHQAGANDSVDVVIPAGTPWWSATGVRVHAHALPATDATTRGWHRLTTAPRTAVDIARWYDTVEAVPIVDAMLAARLVTTTSLRIQLERTAGQGLARVQATLALCDARAESPPESVLRVRLILAGLPAPVPQFEVWLHGRFLARVDLAWPDLRTAVEYDGAWHAAPGQFRKDRRRLNQLIAAGWTVIHVTAADMHSLGDVIGQLGVLLRAPA